MNAEVNDVSDKLQMAQWLSICADPGPHCEQDLVGIWECYRESDVTGDPACKTLYKWRLSMAQVKMAFMDSQPPDSLGAGQSSGTDAMAVLDFDEFLECCARLGIDKYRAVKEVSPAMAVKGFIQNLLNEASPDEVVIQATYIHAERYDAQALTKPVKGESQKDLEKWLACWERMEIMDVHLWPLWEKEVHDILHPLFKELQLIFLAYTRSISEDSAEDAMEMSMDEFHDFVVDVGLETKQYKFDVMCNQFIKANATNTAQVRAQRQEEKRDAQSRGNDDPMWKKRQDAPKKTKGTNDGQEAKKDAELVLYEFMNMLVRIAFWRANPNFGLHGNKDELVPVAFALSNMLNEIILPRAKRQNTAAFRNNEMQDPKLLAMLEQYTPKLREWFDKKVSDDSDGARMGLVSDKLGFDEWLRVLDRQDIVGEWEVEQMSEITGDESTKGNIKCRLSIPTCKAAFMDSQNTEQLGVGQADATSEQVAIEPPSISISHADSELQSTPLQLRSASERRCGPSCLTRVLSLPHCRRCSTLTSGARTLRASPPQSFRPSSSGTRRASSRPFCKTFSVRQARRMSCARAPTSERCATTLATRCRSRTSRLRSTPPSSPNLSS